MAWLRNRGANSITIPDGKTVTPTDDISILLACAGITDPSITTIALLLADTTTLLRVITSNNAMDYLVRSTTWASDVCADSNAMTYIGQDEYAAYKLLSDSTWRSAICSSAYYASVLTTHVPTMTSNTEPSGTASAQNAYSGYPAWQAFDKNSATFWAGSSAAAPSEQITAWIQYEFPSAMKCYVVTYTQYSSTLPMSGYTVLASNDGSSFTTLSSGTRFTKLVISPTQAYKIWRLSAKCWNNTSSYAALPRAKELDFFARASSVQTWLRLGGITDKSYTTVEEVLADTTTLSALMASENAVDYLAFCVDWADAICADSTAMSYIGQNNYAADTLLADEIWHKTICNSIYWSSVLTASIPTMTSDTEPSGVCSANDLYSGYYAYSAFDKNINSRTYSNSYGTGGGYYVQYQFPSSFHAYKAYIAVGSNNSTRYNLVVKIQGSNDGSAWEDLTTNQTLSVVSGSTTTSYCAINGDYKYFRLYKVSSGGSIRYCVNEFDVYGREDV